LSLSYLSKDGYIILKNIYNQEEIKALRAYIFKELKVKKRRGYGETSIHTSEILKHKKIYDLFFKKNLTDKLTKIFGRNFYAFNTINLLVNSHTPFWHRDSQSQKEHYIFDESYSVSKVILYLQKNHNEYGGGLLIKEGSHKPLFGRSTLSKKISSGSSRLQRIMNCFLRTKRVEIDIGDIVIMHANLWHRASPANFKKFGLIKKFGLKNVNDDKYKLMIDWEVSKNHNTAIFYANHQYQRASEGGFFYDASQVDYKKKYPHRILNYIKKNNILILNIKRYKLEQL